MRNILVYFFLFGSIINLVGQSNNQTNAIAKIKYQEAEEAFEAGKFDVALKKLNNVEELLGSSNSKILFLKILIEDTLFKFERRSRIPSFKSIEPLKLDLKFFINNYYSISVEKLATIMRINEYFDTIPGDYLGYKTWFENRVNFWQKRKIILENDLEVQRTYTQSLRDYIVTENKKAINRQLNALLGGTILLVPSAYYWSEVSGTTKESDFKDYIATLGAVFGGIFLTVSMIAGIAYSNSTDEVRYPSVIQSIKNSEIKEKELEGRINWINTILKNSSL
jgi:hypothetical protein